jgi:hypothetical protein
VAIICCLVTTTINLEQIRRIRKERRSKDKIPDEWMNISAVAEFAYSTANNTDRNFI